MLFGQSVKKYTRWLVECSNAVVECDLRVKKGIVPVAYSALRTKVVLAGLLRGADNIELSDLIDDINMVASFQQRPNCFGGSCPCVDTRVFHQTRAYGIRRYLV